MPVEAPSSGAFRMKGPLHSIRRRRSERPANGVDTDAGRAGGADRGAAHRGPASAPPSARLRSARRRARTGSACPRAPSPRTRSAAATARASAARPLRRRLRYLRRVRELGFRDLGGLIFDQHRFAQVNTTLVDGKLQALGAVDAELRALEHALDDRRPLTELREPGVRSARAAERCTAARPASARRAARRCTGRSRSPRWARP